MPEPVIQDANNPQVMSEGPGRLDFAMLDNQGRWQGSGNIAQMLMRSGFNVNALRPCADMGLRAHANAVLRKDEWKLLDTSVTQIARARLRGVADLISRGLTMNLRNPLGTTRVEWETVGDLQPAQIDMSALTESTNDRLVYNLQGIPIPIIHKDFNLNLRHLEASRNRGEPLDTAMAQVCARKVSEKLESLLFNGGYSVGTNGTVYGYTNYTNRNTGSVTATWVSATGAQIVTDVLAMINKAQADHMYGPYILYVAGPVLVHMGDDYKTNSDRTILERILAIPGIQAVLPSDDLTGTNVLLVQMTNDVVDLINGFGPTTVQWETMGGMKINFKVMAIMVPRIKSDDSGNCGIVHYS